MCESPQGCVSDVEWKQNLEWVLAGPRAPISALSSVVDLGRPRSKSDGCQ